MMSWVGYLLTDSEFFLIFFAENSQILLKISVIPILFTFMYLVVLNMLVNNQLNSSLRQKLGTLDNCLTNVWLMPKFWLPDNCQLLDDCLTTALLLPDNYLITARQLLDNCLNMTYAKCLPKVCLKTGWQHSYLKIPDKDILTDCLRAARGLPDDFMPNW